MESTHGGKRPGAGRKAIHPPGRKKYSFHLEPKWAAKLEAYAAAMGESVSGVVAVAVGQWLIDAEKRRGKSKS
jgi:hypothetical protein